MIIKYIIGNKDKTQFLAYDEEGYIFITDDFVEARLYNKDVAISEVELNKSTHFFIYHDLKWIYPVELKLL